MSRFFFLHILSGESWEVADPARWCLENARTPLLERARERLLTLTAADRERIVRLVARRCDLRLVEMGPERVVVHYWVRLSDLREFFQRHGLALEDVAVVLCERKREIVTVTSESEFLFGKALAGSFPVELYLDRWHRRQFEEPGDTQAAPVSWSSFVWEGVEPGLIPWAVLKAAWRTDDSPPCLNYDGPTILTGCGRVECGMFNWRHVLRHACLGCRRQFEENIPSDLGRWLVAHLDRPLLPDFQVIWGKPVKWQPPSDQVSESAWRSTSDTKTAWTKGAR